MRIDLDAAVRTKDGHRAGNVKSAIWDPKRNEISEFVIGTGGLLGRDVLVSYDVLDRASRDGDEIVVDLTKTELDGLATYDTSAYEAPPPGWFAPAAYGFPAGGYLWPIGATEPIAEPAAKETQSRRTPDIRKGMAVHDKDGVAIGVIEQVNVDGTTGELRGVMVRRGGTVERLVRGGDLIEIEAQHIDRVDDEVWLIGNATEIRGRERA